MAKISNWWVFIFNLNDISGIYISKITDDLSSVGTATLTYNRYDDVYNLNW